ncbi:hypothetical protein ACE1TH_15660 [Shouchella sp. JSM 1781072]|uniref:hypothetical protein n=1 Tax=Shouchella sp. JSM 1781072 TaxID=3344581 RepID=UPI0035BF1910
MKMCRRSVVLTLLSLLVLSACTIDQPSHFTDLEGFPSQDDIRSITVISFAEEDDLKLGMTQLEPEVAATFYSLLTDVDIRNGTYEGGEEYSVRLQTNEETFRFLLNEHGNILINGEAFHGTNTEELLSFIQHVDDWDYLE